jgi:periplasmic protein TonB
VAVIEAFDLLGLSIGDIKPVEDDRFDSIKLVIGDAVSIDDDVVEPSFATAPFFVEFGEPARLDPKRVGLTWEVPPPVRTGLRPLSSLGSILVHLLPFLLLITWPTQANEGPALVPIQLVIQEPPPPAPTPETPQPPKPPEPGKLASEDMGEVNPKTAGTAATAAPPAADPNQPNRKETQTAAAASIAPPLPPPPPPKPVPPKERAPVQLPKPSATTAPKAPDPPSEAARPAKFAGPAASRDEYLAYLVTLTRQHLDLLPKSSVGGRHGETAISVAVQSDGTISHLSVARGSGYPDIDERIMQMVAAVRKFPPVPQSFQGNSIELELRLRFPDALERD